MNILTSKSIDKGNSPKDITIIKKMFDSLGIEEYEKNTLNYMSEFINSYIVDILKESKKYMILSKREKINKEDVELAVKNKQNLMYQNRPDVSRMKTLASQVNSIPLPFIPDSPNILMPPIENNLLRNNFQIYSDELNQALINEENKKFSESTSLRPDDINMLGNKRKSYTAGNDSKNNLNIESKLGGFQKKRRKISLNQAFKKTSQENAKKENMLNLNENNNNIKINLNEKKDSNLNSINNDDNNDDNDIDFDNDDNEGENNNNVESTNNLKDEEEDDLKMDDDDNNDDDVEGEEMEGDNENENDSNNEGNESFSDKDDNKNEDKKNDGSNKLKFIHDEDDEDEDYGDGF